MYKGTVRIKNEHGMYAAWTANVDRAIAENLPTSPRRLRERVAHALGHEVNTTSISELLVMLASPEAGVYVFDSDHDAGYLYR